MVKKQSTQKGFVILGAAGIISKIMSVAYVPLLTLILLNEGNGIYNAGYSVYAFVYVLANQGAPVAISKCISEQVALGHYADSRKTFNTALMFMGAIGLLMSLILIIFAGPLSSAINFKSAELTIVAFAPTVLFSALASAYRGYFQGRTNMTPTGVSQILEQFVNCVISIIGAVVMKNYGAGIASSMGLGPVEASSMSLMYAAMGATFGTTLGALVSWCYLAAVFDRNKSSLDKEAEDNGGKPLILPADALKRVLKYIIPISMGATLIVIANTVDLVNVKTRLLAAGFSEQIADSLYGILSTQWQKIINIPLVLVTAMGVAVFPQISEAMAKNDRAKMAKKIKYAFNVLYTITIPAAVGLFVLAEPILTSLFPTTVEPVSITMMQAGAICVVLIGIVNMQTSVLQSVGKVYTAPVIMFFALIIKIILNYVLVANPEINVMGAVIATIICYALAASVNQYFVRKYTVKIRGISKTIGKNLLASAVMGSMAYLVYRIILSLTNGSYIFIVLSLGIAVIAGVLTYVCVMAAINGKLSAITGGYEDRDSDFTEQGLPNRRDDSNYSNDYAMQDKADEQNDYYDSDYLSSESAGESNDDTHSSSLDDSGTSEQNNADNHEVLFRDKSIPSDSEANIDRGDYIRSSEEFISFEGDISSDIFRSINEDTSNNDITTDMLDSNHCSIEKLNDHPSVYEKYIEKIDEDDYL